MLHGKTNYNEEQKELIALCDRECQAVMYDDDDKMDSIVLEYAENIAKAN